MKVNKLRKQKESRDGDLCFEKIERNKSQKFELCKNLIEEKNHGKMKNSSEKSIE